MIGLPAWLRRALARCLVRLADAIEGLRPRHAALLGVVLAAVVGGGIVVFVLQEGGATGAGSIVEAKNQARERALEAMVRERDPARHPAAATRGGAATPPPGRVPEAAPSPAAVPVPEPAAPAPAEVRALEPAAPAPAPATDEVETELSDGGGPPDTVWSMMVAERTLGIDVLPLDGGVASPPEPAAVMPPGAPAIALVIDDMGNDWRAYRRLMRLDVPLTLSFLPEPEAAPVMSAAARGEGAEVFLHMPMQAEKEDAGEGALDVSMPADAIARRLDAALARLDGVSGVNNHMGSRFTADLAASRALMAALARHRLAFVDSMTTPRSVAAAAARAARLKTGVRDVFIDDAADPAVIERQLETLRATALRLGFAIGIAHPRPATLDALDEWVEATRRRGVRFVTASALIALQDCARAEGCPEDQTAGILGSETLH